MKPTRFSSSTRLLLRRNQFQSQSQSNKSSQLSGSCSISPCSDSLCTNQSAWLLRYRTLRNFSTFRGSQAFLRHSVNNGNSNNPCRPPSYMRITRHSTRRVGGMAETLAAMLTGKVVAAIIGATLGLGGLYWLFADDTEEGYFYGGDVSDSSIEDVRAEIRELLIVEDADESYAGGIFREGSCAPAVLRLVLNQAATWSKYDKLGGTNGASLRFDPELSYDHNRGLQPVMEYLSIIKKRHRWMSMSDIWVLASYVAIEEMGGPRIEFRSGRRDCKPPSTDLFPGLEEERFPEWHQGATRLLDWFDRMGLTDREGTALMGGHSCGRLNAKNCKINGTWCDTPLLSKQYFSNLKYTPYMYERKGREHYFDPAHPELVLLPIEGCFFYNARLMKWAEYYAYIEEEVWLRDFANAWKKITEYGVVFDDEATALAETTNTARHSLPPQM